MRRKKRFRRNIKRVWQPPVSSLGSAISLILFPPLFSHKADAKPERIVKTTKLPGSVSDSREVMNTSQTKIRRAWSGEGDGGVSLSPTSARFSHQFSRNPPQYYLEPGNRLDESTERVQTNLHYFTITKARKHCTNRCLFPSWFDFPFFLSRNIYELPWIKNRRLLLTVDTWYDLIYNWTV